MPWISGKSIILSLSGAFERTGLYPKVADAGDKYLDLATSNSTLIDCIQISLA